MSKRRKIITIIVIAIVLIIATGVYFYPKSIHMPTRLTYPYDVTITRGNARINGYLSDELEIEVPERIWWAKVSSISINAFYDFGTDAVIKCIPRGIISADNIYHQESQSYYNLSYGTANLIRYMGNKKKVEIPEEVWGYKVTAMSDAMAYGCFENLKIEEVIIPETVNCIGCSTFEGCSNLKQIKLPSQLKIISATSFKECGIESIVIPESVERINGRAFAYSKLQEITGLENVEYIGSDPFRGTPWEESIESEFVCFDNKFFLYRGDEEEVIIPSTVIEVKGAFAREEGYPYPIKVKKVFISESVSLISAYSFSGQEGIEVYIPDTVEVIGEFFSDTKSIFGSHDEDVGTIVTTAGSPAEAYAKEEKIPCRIITKEEMQQEMEAAKKRQENKS